MLSAQSAARSLIWQKMHWPRVQGGRVAVPDVGLHRTDIFGVWCRRHPRAIAVAVTALLLLSGCGGGGGGGAPAPQIIQPVFVPPAPAPPPPPPPPADPDDFRTPEYELSWALEAIHAAETYAKGFTGQGVIVGIVDFNFALNSAEVNYHADSLGRDPFLLQIFEAQIGEPEDDSEHGHAVAAVAAAIKNNSGMHGVAFDATVLAVDFFSNANVIEQTSGGVLFHISDPYSYITARGGRIVNTSFGFDTGDIIVDPPDVNEKFATVSRARAVANGALLVISAGNNGNTGPSLSTLDLISELANNNLLDNGSGALMVVGALRENGTLASFSNQAGVSRNYYLAAPGAAVVAPLNGTLQLLSGTSFSAPMVSGAAAVIMQRWPTITARAVAEILFASATDLGTPGVDDVYGHGALNLDAAVQPIGTTTFAVAGGVAPEVEASGMILGSAFGDAPALRAALSTTMMLDRFGRDFAVDASRLASARPSAFPLAALLARKRGWHAAILPMGMRSAFRLDLRSDPLYGRVSNGGLAPEPSHQPLFQFFGAGESFAWSAGLGLGLSDALAARQGGNRFGANALSYAFTPLLTAHRSTFATLGFSFSEETTLSFGMSSGRNIGVENHPLPALRADAPVHAAAMRLDHSGGAAIFSVEFGAMSEGNALLGSLSAGGLRLSNASSTTWATLTAETDLDARWAVKGAFTLAGTRAQRATGTLIDSFGPIFLTGFSLGLSGRTLFDTDDLLSVTLSQPLRAEYAPVTLLTGVGRDLTTGGILFGETKTSLVSSGRELALEVGYRRPFGAWMAEIGAVTRIDAGHIEGATATAGMVWLSRRF
ncbi:MAG: S8 family serine peptidase [Proteobacteria bacterium]|nr:S8 family serine peptidase [Pseudomonadota bacterium]